MTVNDRLLLTRRTAGKFHSHWQIVFLSIVGIAIFVNHGFAQSALPHAQLTSIFPLGGRQASTAEVTISGTDLDGVKALHFSHPGIVATLKMSKPSPWQKTPTPLVNQFSVKIASNVPPGIYEARAVGLYGISNPRAFVVGWRDEVVQSNSSESLEKATSISLGQTYNGRVKSSEISYLKFQGKKDTAIVIDCQAQRIDSRLDATLILLDAQGHQLSKIRNQIRRDPVISYTLPQDGIYYIALHDMTYAGGADYFYRLTVHADPHLDFVFPPVGRAGEKNKFTLYGRNLPGGKPTSIKVGNHTLQSLQVEIKLPKIENPNSLKLPETMQATFEHGYPIISYRFGDQQKPSNALAIGITNQSIVLEKEPNNEPAKAQKIQLPGEIVGQFNPRYDQDWYTFEAKKGEVYWLDILSHRLGLPTDAYCSVHRVTVDKNGKETVTTLKELDDPPQITNNPSLNLRIDDPSFRFQVPQDGTYRILVRDLHYRSRGKPSYVYRMILRKDQPNFSLIANARFVEATKNSGRAMTWSALLRKGGLAAYTVTAIRYNGFQGPIHLSVEGLPPGVTASKVVIGETENHAVLVLKAEVSAAAWAGEIRIVGKSTIHDKAVQHQARGATVIWGSKNKNETSRSRLTRNIALAISESENAPAVIEAGSNKIWETARGGVLEIPVKVTRYGNFKNALQLVLVKQNKSLKVNKCSIAAKASDGKIRVEVNSSTPPGYYTFALYSNTETLYTRNPQALKSANNRKAELAKVATEVQSQVKQAKQVKQQTEIKTKSAQANVQKMKQALINSSQVATQLQNKLKEVIKQLDMTQKAVAKKPKDQNLIAKRDEAQKKMQQSTSEVQQAIEKKNNMQKTVQNAETTLAQVKKELNLAEQKAAQTAKMLQQFQVVKKAADLRATALAKLAKPKKLKFSLVSTPIVIRVSSLPIDVSVVNRKIELKPGETKTIAVTVTRKFGFKDKVDFNLVQPQGVVGFQTKKTSIIASQTQGEIQFTATKKAVVGSHAFQLKVQMQFNGKRVSEDIPIQVSILKN